MHVLSKYVIGSGANLSSEIIKGALLRQVEYPNKDIFPYKETNRLYPYKEV
jgi:hypothetical protein